MQFEAKSRILERMSPETSLRNRKKIKQRAAFIDAAYRLFLDQGYDATTLDQICAECDVTVQTLLRYFGTKEDMLFARQPKILARVEKGLKRSQNAGDPIKYWIRFLNASARRLVESEEIFNTYRIIECTPSLKAKYFTIIKAYEQLVERALCEKLGVNPGDDLHSTLLAKLIVMGPVEECLRLVAKGDITELVDRCNLVTQYALDNFNRPRNWQFSTTPTGRPRRARVRKQGLSSTT